MTDLTGGSGMSRDLRELSEDASPGPWSVGPEGFGIVPADPHENTRLGADSRYIVALVNWHRAALLADTPSVEVDDGDGGRWKGIDGEGRAIRPSVEPAGVGARAGRIVARLPRRGYIHDAG